jgi:hypothetical protein
MIAKPKTPNFANNAQYTFSMSNLEFSNQDGSEVANPGVIAEERPLPKNIVQVVAKNASFAYEISQDLATSLAPLAQKSPKRSKPAICPVCKHIRRITNITAKNMRFFKSEIKKSIKNIPMTTTKVDLPPDKNNEKTHDVTKNIDLDLSP